MAVPVGRKPILCEFSIDGFQPTLYTPEMWFCSMGSTQMITDPFLALMREIFWPTAQPTMGQAVLAVTWALDHAIAVNPGGVNGPVQIAVLERHKSGDFRGCVPRFVEKERRPPLRHQGIRSGGNLRVFENLAQTLVAVDAP